jgi:CNT family concentrative nucleoside transporter
VIGALWVVQTAAERLAAARSGLDTPLLERLLGLVGLATMLAIAYAISYDRKRINWRIVGAGVGLQIVFGVIVLKTTPGRWLFTFANEVVTGLLSFQEQGARFVFGNLVQNEVPLGGGVSGVAQTGAFFAFNVLPTIIFFSALMTVLYYLNVMQWIVKGIAWVMQKTLKTSGAETLSAAGNIFLGQTEAPLLIKPFVGKMTNSELNTVMVGGFATVAGGVMAAYVGMLKGYFPDIAGHLLTASVMNAPAGLLLSKMILPESGTPETRDTLHIVVEKQEANVIEAAASGAATGVQLAINVAAMLMAFVALVALINFGIGWVGGLMGHPEISLQWLLGKALWPITVLMGVPPADAATVGGFIGEKTALNEFVAYADFAQQMGNGLALSPKAAIMTTYCLLGFANFSSIAIQIGGIGGLAPHRRSDISRLGLRAMIAGNLAAFMSASIAGMLV